VRQLVCMLGRTVARTRSLTKIVLLATVVIVVVVIGRDASVVTGSAQAAPPTATLSVPASSGPKAPHISPSARGVITALAGDRWTISTTEGTTITVALSGQTMFGTPKTPTVRAQFSLGTPIAVTGPLSGNTVRAERIIIPITGSTPAPSVTAPAPTPPPAAPAAVTGCPVSAELSQALAYATSRGEQTAIAVYDTATGTYTTAGNADAEFSSASVVKVFIATDLLLTDQMTGDTASTAYQMITASDDDDSDNLYGLVGGDSVITTIANHYGITNLGSPPADTGQWGETKITADGLVHLYAKLKADPQVWPWLSHAMSNTTQVGTDGTNQYFGIPAAAQDWAVKQGWMTGLGPGSTYDSTGYVDSDRYAIAILTYGSVSQYGRYMSNTITQMAKDIMPGGLLGGASRPCPA
jgi:hypothetical protein